MAVQLLNAAGANQTGLWFNTRVTGTGADPKMRVRAYGDFNVAVTIEGSHLVDGTGDEYELGTIAPGGGVLDIDFPIERVRAKTGDLAPGTSATVLMSMAQ